jgi:tetratricopeptide (TPR) repeat protein
MGITMHRLGLAATACLALWLLAGCEHGPDTGETEPDPDQSRRPTPATRLATPQEQDERSLDAIAERLKLPSRQEAAEERKARLEASRQSDAQRRAQIIQRHLTNLRDKDPETRVSAAQYLAQLDAFEAVPQLIEALKDEHLYVAISAHGALNRITGKNFGHRGYDAWKLWLASNPSKPTWSQRVAVPQRSANVEGLRCLGQGEFRKAAGLFLDSVRTRAVVPDYRNNLGLALMELAREDAWFYSYALEQFAEAIRLDPSLPQPYMNAGSCFSRMGRKADALYWHRRALELDVNGCLWEHAWTLGKEHLAAKEYDLAREFLEQALTMGELAKKQDPYVHRDLALTYYGLGRFRDAWREVGTLKALGYDMSPEFIAKLESAQPQTGLEHDDLGPPKPSAAP